MASGGCIILVLITGSGFEMTIHFKKVPVTSRNLLAIDQHFPGMTGTFN
jgi:hypothetical protein